MRAPAGERGSSTVEVAVLVPLLAVLVLLAVQVALWAIADEAVQQVASQAALAAAGLGSTVQAGEAAGRQQASQLGGPVLVDPAVTVTEVDPDTVVAVVTGRAESILPWFHPPVRAQRVATVQRFRSGP